MKERLKHIVQHSGMKLTAIARESGLTLAQWKGVLYAGSRVNEDHIHYVAQKWPQFVYWLVTGNTQQDCGNTSPDREEFNRLNKRLST